MTDADRIARAIAVLGYVAEHGPNRLDRSVLHEARNIAGRELEEFGSASDLYHYEPNDSRLDPQTLKAATVTLSKLEELVGPGEARLLQNAARELHRHLEVMQEA
jgi:hypothetical protein